MRLTTLWSNLTGPSVHETTTTTPKLRGRGRTTSRPATSSGERTTVKFSFECDGELNLMEPVLSKPLVEPRPKSAISPEGKKSTRRSRGSSVSSAKSGKGMSRRRSLFGEKRAAAKEDVPAVPTLPSLNDIYSRQIAFASEGGVLASRSSNRNECFQQQRSTLDTGPKAFKKPPIFARAPLAESQQPPLPSDTEHAGGKPLVYTLTPAMAVTSARLAGAVSELPADCPGSVARGDAESKAVEEKPLPAIPESSLKKTRRKSIREVLRKRARSSAPDAFVWRPEVDAPPMPALSNS